ncbi:L-fuconate dehydratase [Cysteiniphilum halobium]|uniref:L-fuconate dehydratase n=1 Tax=Cysteiniphilum halobium TaxID=2219059 RepID=UPI000E65A86B|nr:L-fuconate dehydratase [Cysteiniphilum halobium]
MTKEIIITELNVYDIRFPTSKSLAGSDAMNKDPDYSAAYVTLHTNQPELEGNGLTFTIGRGNEICTLAIKALAPLLIGKKLVDFTKDMGAFWKYITNDSQLRWIGPDKGAIHLATAAVVNAVWDLWAKQQAKPLWELVVDMSPEELARCIDFTYLTDVLTPNEALALLQKQAPHKAQRKKEMLTKGYPAYTTSAGWLGYSDEKLRRLCQEAIDAGWNHIKLKVGDNLQDDIRRCTIAREVIGPHRKLMMDANQRWEVSQAIQWMDALKQFKPWFIEEPTSPDDILGHKKIKDAISPIWVASGEMCQNRILFKQFIESGALDIVQIDSCRLGGVNEVLAVYLMAAKFNIPVCPHAGGVGLCEYVQHLAMIDYICISGSLTDRVLEYVDHLHEHFVAPVKIEKGHYIAPTVPGYSITMYPETINQYEFPNGLKWAAIS